MVAHSLLFILVRITCLLGASDSPADKVLAEELALLSGTWQLESVESNGEKEDVAAREIRVEITGHKWIFRAPGSTPVVYALKLGPTNMPKTMDLTLLAPKEKKEARAEAPRPSEGIYEISKEQLRVCASDLKRDGPRERPVTFTAKRDSGFTILVLKRLKQ